MRTGACWHEHCWSWAAWRVAVLLTSTVCAVLTSTVSRLCWQTWVGCVAVDHIHCCWLLADRLAAKNVVSKMTCLVLSEMLKLNSANQFEMLCEGVWHLCLAAYTQLLHACSNALSLVCCCLALIRRCVWLVHCCLALIRLCGWRWWVRQFSWSLSAVPLPWWSPLKTAN